MGDVAEDLTREIETELLITKLNWSKILYCDVVDDIKLVK